MFNKKMQYVIKSVPTDDKQALEDLLNSMSEQGWDLYTMHEIESDSSIDFNCIFVREKQDDSTNLDDIVNITSFKYRMEKMLSSSIAPYESCKEIQIKIADQKDRIKRIKFQLESDSLSIDDKNKLNEQMSDELNLLSSLKQTLVNEISPDTMFASLKEEKLTIKLSEEIINFASLENERGLLAETVRIRQNLADELGYVIPHIHFHNGDDLGQNEFSILVHDIEVFKGVVFDGYKAYFKEDLKGYKLTSDDIVLFDEIENKKIIWIKEDKSRDFWEKGLSPIEYIGKAIEYIAIKEVSDIMDYNDINKYLEKVIENNSFLIDNIIPEFITIADLKYLLTCLLREKVSIKNIIYLFEKINDYANEPTKEDLLDKVRLAFSKQIIKDIAKTSDLKIIEFNDDTLEKVDKFFNSNDDNIIRIDANDVQEIATNICKIVKSKKLTQPILAVPMDLRHMCFVILSEFIPNLKVLAYEELVSDSDIKFIAKI